MKKLLILFIALLTLHAGTLAQTRDPLDIYYQTGKVQPLILNYNVDRASVLRFYTIANSPERRQRLKKFYEDYLRQLEQLGFDKMTTSDKVDYILTKRDLNNQLHLLALEEQEYNR